MFHLDGRTFLTYSLMRCNAARTRSSKRLSLRRRIQNSTMAKTTQSMMKCFRTSQANQLTQDGRLRSFFDFHSLPIVICSRSAATSADSFVMALSIFFCHRLPFLFDASSPSSSAASSSMSICRCERSSASSSSLMGLRTFIGPSLPFCGCRVRRSLSLALGEEEDELGELCRIWFHTNSSSETNSLPSLE